jgi:dTDP-4-amino-4,6-dideoxygalactose transaminase
LSSGYTEIIKNLKFKIENPEPSDNRQPIPIAIGTDNRQPTTDNREPTTDNRQLTTPNYHLFYLIFPDLESRTEYAKNLKEKGILAVFHYQSLHRSEYARTHFPEQYSRHLPNSARFSDCLLRLPMFYELPELSQMLE